MQLIFFEKDYTQNYNDSIHSSIDKAKEGINIHHPVQWYTVAEMTCKKRLNECHRNIF